LNRVGTVVPSTTPVVRCCDTVDVLVFYYPECAEQQFEDR
jgi:hypothetical protein